MKTRFFFLVLLMQTFMLKASVQKTAEAKVDRATVFLQGAMLYSSASFSLSQGINECVFLHTSPFADQGSVTASGKGNFTIMEVHHAIDYPEPKQKKSGTHPMLKSLKLLNDSIEEITAVMDELTDRLQILTNEKNLIQNNRLLKGETKRDTLALVKEAVEFYRARLNNISAEQAKLKKQQRQWSEQLALMQQRAAAYNELIAAVEDPEPQRNPLYKIIVSVLAQAPVQAEITISYFVQNAGWSPVYDLKAASGSKSMSVVQSAKVFQNSGLDWNQTRLTLSTGQPQTSLEKPVLSSSYLSLLFQRNRTAVVSGDMSKGLFAPDRPQILSSKQESVDDVADYSFDYTTTSDRAVLTEYDIKLKYNISSNNKAHWVSIQEKELKAAMEYATAPVQDQGVFLMAHLTGWESLDLLSGPARVFLDGAFVGNTQFNPQSVSDTLSMSLGRDRTWSVSRKKTKEKKSDKILADEKWVTVEYEIQLRNNHTKDAEILLEDRIPLVTQNTISVKLLQSDGAEYNPQTGILKWNKKVKAQESTKVRFSFEVRYPAGASLAGL
jgi:uncharacterized protein (TIGR02231 family)